MTIDNTLIVAGIVAGTSLITIFLNNRHALNIKRIDAEQKANEHKLSIRTAYVNKKIEAGIDFVSKTTVRINTHYLVTVFCKYLIENKVFHKEYYNAINKARDKQREINLNNNLSPHLFFDIISFNEEANALILEYNSQQIILNDYLDSEGNNEYTSEVDLAVKKSLEINEQIIKVYQRMNIDVRSEVAKYDII